MKILLVYPEYPDTFWSFSHALKFVRKKAAYPPLGLLTIAAMLPSEWSKRIVDMNIRKLKDEDILWADYVFVSAMSVQRDSVIQVIKDCKSLGIPVIAGGPLFTTCSEDFSMVDHLVLNEAEITLPLFLDDLRKESLKKEYASSERADIKKAPVPMFELIDMKKYASMSIQYSRGCPFDCEFCNIVELYGRVPRTKTAEQLIAEFERLYKLGWRGATFVVDDNFIGNKNKLKQDILPAIIRWSEKKGYPFEFFTEASINLADDEALMRMMVQAGFISIFVGIESPHKGSIEECGKNQNKNRDMIQSIHKMHRFGLEVQGGFILGFDQDPESIFDEMIRFIQESGVVTAMVGLLTALPSTKLHRRLSQEKRIIFGTSGNNTDFSLNFVPKMDSQRLIDGYRRVVSTIYSPKKFYARLQRLLKEYNPSQLPRLFHLDSSKFIAGIKSIWYLGILGKERYYFWKMILQSLWKYPKLIPMVITLSIYGYHFRRAFEEDIRRLETE